MQTVSCSIFEFVNLISIFILYVRVIQISTVVHANLGAIFKTLSKISLKNGGFRLIRFLYMAFSCSNEKKTSARRIEQLTDFIQIC